MLVLSLRLNPTFLKKSLVFLKLRDQKLGSLLVVLLLSKS